MSTETSDLFSLSQNSEQAYDPSVAFRYHADGVRNEACGHLRAYGHVVGEKVHAQIAVSRCKRWECPECWDKPHGALEREVERILAGIFPNEPDAKENDLTELIVTPSCEAGLLREGWYRADIIQRLRKAYESALTPPGAWVYHENLCGGLDRCPQQAHLHVFVRRMADTRTNPFFGASVDVRSKPGLRECLRVATRVLLSPSLGRGRPKMVRWIGWFGRRKGVGVSKTPTGEPMPKPQKVRFCQLCQKEVAQRDFKPLTFRRFKPDKEEWREESTEDVAFLGREWGR